MGISNKKSDGNITVKGMEISFSSLVGFGCWILFCFILFHFVLYIHKNATELFSSINTCEIIG